MDDHIYEEIMHYAECELIPAFQEELEANGGKMSDCSRYEEVKALCTALNAIAPYAGYGRVTPRDIANLKIYY